MLVTVKRPPVGDKLAILSLSTPNDLSVELDGPLGLVSSAPDPAATALARHRKRLRRVLFDNSAEARRCSELAPDSEHRVATPDDRLPDLDSALEALLSPVVGLPGGGSLTLEQTAALTSIDVDSGAQSAEPRSKVNRDAVAALPRQLRLRGIGGQVAVDFLDPGSQKARASLRRALERTLATEVPDTRLVALTASGLAVLERPRHGATLLEVAMEPLSDGQIGWRFKPRWLAAALVSRLQRERGRLGGVRGLRLRVSPAVAAALQTPEWALLEDLEDAIGSRADLRIEDQRKDVNGEGEFL